MGPAGHQHADVAGGTPGQQRGDARLAAGRGGALVLVQAVHHQQQPLLTLADPPGGQVEQEDALPVPSRRGRGRRLVRDRGQLLDHRLGEGHAVGLAGQAPGHEERHHPDPGRRMDHEPGRQGRLPGPGVRPPPQVGLVAGTELDQLGQFLLAAAQLNGGEVADLGEVAGLHQLRVGRRHHLAEVVRPSREAGEVAELPQPAGGEALVPAVHPGRGQPPEPVGAVMLGDQADDPAGTPHRRARHAAPRRPLRVRVALGRRHRDLEGPLAPVGQHRDGPNGMGRVPVLRRHAALGRYRVVAQLEQWEAHRAALQDRVALRHPAEPDRLHLPLVLGPGGDGDHGHVHLRVRPRHLTLGGPLARPVGVEPDPHPGRASDDMGGRQHRLRRDPVPRPAAVRPPAPGRDDQLGDPLRIDPGRPAAQARHRRYRSPGASSLATHTLPPPASRGCRESLTRWVETSLALASPPSSMHPEPDLGPAAGRLLDGYGGLELDRAQLEPELLALAVVHGRLQLAAQLADHLGQFDHPSSQRATGVVRVTLPRFVIPPWGSRRLVGLMACMGCAERRTLS